MDRRVYIGQLVDGKYKLVDLLGEGGMAAVYLAEHVLLHKKVALKVLRSDQVKEETAVKRFYREAQATAAIGHPAIINIYDVGHAPWGEPYLVMEYLRGESLGTLIERVGSLSLAEAAALIAPVLEGLGAAHQSGIVHRDLKPENIFLSKNKSGGVEVKIIDFGVSKFTRTAGDFTQLTQLGSIVGTPHYMPLEQLLGQEIDHRADIYACGVVLYEMLTGRRPYEAPNYTAVLGRIMSQQMTPPRDANPQFPFQAEPLILKAMAREPKDRYPSAAAMLTAVTSLASEDLRTIGAQTMATRVSDAFVGLGTLGRPQRQSAISQEALDVLLDAPRSAFPDRRGALPSTSASRPTRGTSADAWSKSDTHLRRPRRMGWILAGVFGGSLVLAAGIITAVLFVEGRERSSAGIVPVVAAPISAAPVATSVSPPVQEASLATIPPPRPDSVSIHLLDLPIGSRVQFDGGLVSDNPFRVRARDNPVPLRVDAEGYDAFELSVIPNQDVAIVVQLTPTGNSNGRSHTRRHHRERDQTEQGTDAAASAEPVPTPQSPRLSVEDTDYRLKE